jgi:metal-sulfur cluster biosynthetic enzyme
VLAEADVRAALRTVVDPCSIATGVPIDLLDMGLVKRIEIDRGHVLVELRLTSPICWQSMNIRDAIREAVGRIDGVDTIQVPVDHGADWMPDMMSPAARARLRRARPLTDSGRRT